MERIAMIWINNELAYQGNKLLKLENSYNTLSGDNTEYVHAHNVMIEARRKMITILGKYKTAEIKKNIEHRNGENQAGAGHDKQPYVEPTSAPKLTCGPPDSPTGERLANKSQLETCQWCGGSGMRYEGIMGEQLCKYCSG